MTSREYAIQQRYPRLKRAMLGPVAPIAKRWALSGIPDERKASVVRRLVVPPVGASARNFVRHVEPGFSYGGNTQDLLGLFVHLFGVWEPNLTAFLCRRLSTGDTFIDVGANSGWFTAMGAALVGPSGRVVGIEASPTIAGRLQANLDRNDFSQARVLNAAALAGPGVVDIIDGPAEHTGLTRTAQGHSAGGVQVAGDALPHLLTPDEIALARVVKIDVEGAEYDVVKGLAPSLDQFPQSCEFVIEVGPERAGRVEEVDALIQTFTSRGYRAYYLPNFYDVRSYMLQDVATELEPITTRPTREMDIVFSRRGDSTLPL